MHTSHADELLAHEAACRRLDCIGIDRGDHARSRFALSANTGRDLSSSNNRSLTLGSNVADNRTSQLGRVHADNAQRKILEAGVLLFARHGFQRTSIADIAREAQISRATLYLRFRDKRAVFEAIASWQVATALADAEAAWRPDIETAGNLEATILAKDLAFFRLLTATPHGAELLAVDAELTASMSRPSTQVLPRC